jgi:cell division protein FtsB
LNFPPDAEINRIREEALRLSAENARLCAENTRLQEENRNLRANAYCSPGLAEAFRDALGTTLGTRVNECSCDVPASYR